MTTRSIIGEYYLPRTYIGSDYTTESTSIQIYNEDDDCMHIVRMETLLDNSHVFNAAGGVDTTHFKDDDEKHPFLINKKGDAKQYVGELDDTELPEATYRAIVKAIVAAAKENVGGDDIGKMKKWIADVLEFTSGGDGGAPDGDGGAAASGGGAAARDPWKDILDNGFEIFNHIANIAGTGTTDFQALYDALNGEQEDVKKGALEAIADVIGKLSFPTTEKARVAYITALNTGLKRVKISSITPGTPPTGNLTQLSKKIEKIQATREMYKSLATIPNMTSILASVDAAVWKGTPGLLKTLHFNEEVKKAIRTAYKTALGAKRVAVSTTTLDAALRDMAAAADSEEDFVSFMNNVAKWLKKRYGIRDEDIPKDFATYATDFSGIGTTPSRRVAGSSAFADLDIVWPTDNGRYAHVLAKLAVGTDQTIEDYAYVAYFYTELSKQMLKKLLHNDIPLPFTFALVRPNCRYETLGVTVMARGEQTCFMARRPGNFTLSHDHSAGYINATYNAYFGLVIPRKEDIRNSLFDFPSGYHGGRGVKFYAEKDHFDSPTTSSMLAVPMTYPEAQHLFGKPFDLRGKFVLEHNSVSENDIAENENLHYSYGHWVKRKWSIPDGKSSSDNYVATNTILFMGTYQQYNSANQNFSDEVRGNGHMASLAAPGARSITSGNVTVDDMHRLGLMSAKRMAH